ncbi:MAG: hypothetical protein GXO03_03025, partial [Aquificae bacterium]|nr:hypothetical protein [Aquificota bacterium]
MGLLLRLLVLAGTAGLTGYFLGRLAKERENREALKLVESSRIREEKKCRILEDYLKGRIGW